MNAPFLRLPRPEAAGAIASLALAIADHARKLGLAVVYLRASKVRRSATKSLAVRDVRNRLWLLRISDHHRPTNTGYEVPHFNLVTLDGREGSELAFGFLNRVSRGEERWHEPRRTRIRKGQHVRGQRR